MIVLIIIIAAMVLGTLLRPKHFIIQKNKYKYKQ